MAHSPSVDRFPNLDQLVRNGGSYLIGETRSIRDAAIASDAQVVYVALIRRQGESLDDLHQRLDETLGEVIRGERPPVNEVPDGRFYVGRKRREGAR